MYVVRTRRGQCIPACIRRPATGPERLGSPSKRHSAGHGGLDGAAFVIAAAHPASKAAPRRCWHTPAADGDAVLINPSDSQDQARHALTTRQRPVCHRCFSPRQVPTYSYSYACFRAARSLPPTQAPGCPADPAAGMAKAPRLRRQTGFVGTRGGGQGSPERQSPAVWERAVFGQSAPANLNRHI